MSWAKDVPKRLRLGHKTVRVIVLEASEAQDEAVYGTAKLASQRIYLDPSMSKEKAAETLLHELRHHLWSEWGLKAKESEEQVVTVLTRAECWALRQNPKAVRWIFKNLGVLR